MIRRTIKKYFNALSTSEARRALDSWGIEYKRQDDGTIVVEGDLIISSKGLHALPDLRKVVVKGSFICSNNKLRSLEGAPQVVEVDFYCSENILTSLKGAPEKVGRSFFCQSNRLKSLKGITQEIGGGIWCFSNQLTSLEGCPEELISVSCWNNKLTSLEGGPKIVRDNYWCYENELTSLKGAPLKVGKKFHCYSNKLTNLEDAPREFVDLQSDFGSYGSFKEIPEKVLYFPKTCAEIAHEKDLVILEKSRKAVALQKPLKIKKIRFN